MKETLPSEALAERKSGNSGRVFGVLGLTLLLFIGPQILLGLGLAIVESYNPGFVGRVLSDADVGANFILYGSLELLTLFMLSLVLRFRKQSWASLGLKRQGLAKLWMVIPAYFIYLFMTVSLIVIAGIFLDSSVLDQEQDLGYENATQAWELGAAFLALVVIAPFVEELLFRGFLFKSLRQNIALWAAVFISAALFGLAHLQINVGLDTFALAIMLALLLEKTGNLFISVGLHSLKNAVAFTFLFGESVQALF